jgi:hypothetical protein
MARWSDPARDRAAEQASIANRLYPGLNLYEDLSTATEPGFQVGYSDWTTQCSTWP